MSRFSVHKFNKKLCRKCHQFEHFRHRSNSQPVKSHTVCDFFSIQQILLRGWCFHIFTLALCAPYGRFSVPAYNELPGKINAFRMNVRKSDFLIDWTFFFASRPFMCNDIMRLRLARAYHTFQVTVVCMSISYCNNMNIGPCHEDSISMYAILCVCA